MTPPSLHRQPLPTATCRPPSRGVRRFARYFAAAAALGVPALCAAQAPGPANATGGNPPAANPAAPAAPPVVHGNFIPDGVKSSQQAPAAFMLNDFVSKEVALLSHPDVKAQSDARQNLINAAYSASSPPSAVYQDAYANALNAALVKQFTNADMRVRLNAAIVAARVAGTMTNNTRLAPAATKAVADKAEPVVLWGVKAGRTILPVQMDVPAAARDAKLAQGIVQAVDRFPDSDAIVDEAYTDLAGELFRNRNVAAGRKTGVLPYVLALMNVRIQQFQQANAGAAAAAANGNPPPLPGSPGAEAEMITFLSNEAWPLVAADPNAKKQVGRAIVDLTNVLVQLAPNVPKRAPGEDGPGRKDLIDTLNRIGSAAIIISSYEKNAPIKTAAGPLQTATDNTPGPILTTAAQSLEQAFADAKLLAPPPAPAAPAPVANPAAPAAPAAAAGR